MIYYPIYIPTLNRFNHFKECVESLAQCTHADKTELVIGLDYPPSEKYQEGHNQIKKFIPTINGFKKVTVFEQKENIGAIANWNMLKEYCFEHYDAAIGTEDDNIFSPCFLDYMNQGLERFKYDEKIVSISGYNYEECYNDTEYKILCSYDNRAWGMGVWKHKEIKIKDAINRTDFYTKILKSPIKSNKILKIYPYLICMLLLMIKSNKKWGDVRRSTYNIITNHYQLKPRISLVRNMGYDGTGINCGKIKIYSRQYINQEKYFSLPNKIEYYQTTKHKDGLYNVGLPQKANEKNEMINKIKTDLQIYRNPQLYNFKIKIKAKISHFIMAITHPRYIGGWILRKLKIKK